ncbi:MAG TPA: hypothetical protein VFA59_00920 [Vicinamibacterales bacterium]|nr:hypothetical protein [Vicinamibacterales bacterium]
MTSLLAAVSFTMSLFPQPKQPAPPPKIDWNAPPPAADTTKPKVVCGMTLVPAQPSVDSKMPKAPIPGDRQFPMRTVQPQTCAQK